MNGATFAVRRATPADKEAVIALSRAISADDFIPDLYDWWMSATWPEGLYVAEQEGRIIGCYALEFPGPGQAYLYAMRIHPEVQGRGIGTRFCRLQVEHARSAGAKEIYLLSALDNHRAHRVVAKNGFRNRGAWLVYDGLTCLPALPPVRQARPAVPADRPLVERFREERERGPLAGVIASPASAWSVRSVLEADWDLANLAVVPGEAGLEGLMILSENEDGLLIRRLDGTPAAAADLLALAVQRMAERGGGALSISLPMAAEPLLAPLGLNPDDGFRAYVFHLPPGVSLPET